MCLMRPISQIQVNGKHLQKPDKVESYRARDEMVNICCQTSIQLVRSLGFIMRAY